MLTNKDQDDEFFQFAISTLRSMATINRRMVENIEEAARIEEYVQQSSVLEDQTPALSER